MEEYHDAANVVCPTEEWLTRANLSGARTHRRALDHKARIVTVVDGSHMSRDEALKLYALSEEEYESWQALMSRHDLEPLQPMRPRKLRVVPG